MDERAKLSYLQWQEKYLVENPYQVFVLLPIGVPDEQATNLKFDLGDEEVVRDIRGSSTTFTLDEHGFTVSSMEMSPHPLSEMDIVNDYIPKTCKLVKEAVNAELIIPFDWRIRMSTSPITAEVINLEDKMIPLLPAVHVHVDQTPDSMKQRVKFHAPEELHRFKDGRVRIINSWKPLNQVVEDWPLTVCDASSVSQEDLVAVDHVRRKHIGESYYLLYRPSHKWWYLSQQRRDEVILVKMCDSLKVGCPHASFSRLDAALKGTRRKSIEVRMLVFSS